MRADDVVGFEPHSLSNILRAVFDDERSGWARRAARHFGYASGDTIRPVARGNILHFADFERLRASCLQQLRSMIDPDTASSIAISATDIAVLLARGRSSTSFGIGG